MDIHSVNSEYRAAIEAELSAALSGCGAPEPLLGAMKYSMEAGGKRLRPCLALGVCDMLGGDRSVALTLGCGIEMIHTYSLIHDDLPCMDDDDMRRGKPSSHKVYGEGQAVLAGDGLLSLAFEYMLSRALRFNSINCFRGVYEIAKRAGVSGMVAGQSRDLEAENGSSVDEAELIYIHTHKTADMLTASVLAGAYSAGASEEKLAALERFSEKMGLLFQITDDILDSEGDEALVGKTLGKDNGSSKLTYVTLHGMDRAKKLAEDTALEALKILDDSFGGDAEYLKMTVSNMVGRRY